MVTSWKSSYISSCTDFVSLLMQNRNRLFTPYFVWCKGVSLDADALRIARIYLGAKWCTITPFARIMEEVNLALHLLTFWKIMAVLFCKFANLNIWIHGCEFRFPTTRSTSVNYNITNLNFHVWITEWVHIRTLIFMLYIKNQH